MWNQKLDLQRGDKESQGTDGTEITRRDSMGTLA